jgi:hypothetical protein
MGTGLETAAEMETLAINYQAALKVAASTMFAELFVFAGMLCFVAAIPALWLLKQSTNSN